IAALKLLESLSVHVHAASKVAEVGATGVKLANGTFLPAELVVWAAGVKAPDFLRNLDGLETNRINQLLVLPTLRTTHDENIFALGDCAACPWQDRPEAYVPPRAQAAHQQATHLVKPNQAAPDRPAAAAMALSRLRLARLVGRVFNGRKPDGRASRRDPLDRGPVRPPHVPLALQAA